LKIANETMYGALRLVSVEQGMYIHIFLRSQKVSPKL
jgi:hypothetical protein